MGVLVPNVASAVIGTGVLIVIESIILSVLMQVVFVMNLLMILAIVRMLFMVTLVVCVNVTIINDNC